MEKTLQVTVSGTDFNGFVWQNVFHLSSDDQDEPMSSHLLQTCNWVEATLIPDMLDAMSDQANVLDVAARYTAGSSSYTFHKPINLPGNRDETQESGAIAGRIKWFPAVGANTGHQFVPGVCVGDFVNDFISPGYLTLLDTVKAAYLALTGASAPYDWTFVIYKKSTGGSEAVDSGESMNRIGVLSKRVRA